MTIAKHRWVIVLAAGEGSRLRAFTARATGEPIPKQFYALRGTKSMLQQTLDRALRLVPPERIVVIVAAQHRQWWEPELTDLPPGNVVVQPENRGTAAGILLPLLLIHRRDPDAEVLIMPSDHFVERNDILCSVLEEAWLEAREPGDRIVLVGITPEKADPDFGWVLPAGLRGPRALRRVSAFVEKPGLDVAHDLMGKGALINAFLVIARSRSLLRLYRRQPSLLKAFDAFLGEGAAGIPEGVALARLYEQVPTFDFSRDLLESSADLWVLPAPPCGWSDLGTPERVVACLERNRPLRLSKRSTSRTVSDLAKGAKAAALVGFSKPSWAPSMVGSPL